MTIRVRFDTIALHWCSKVLRYPIIKGQRHHGRIIYAHFVYGMLLHYRRFEVFTLDRERGRRMWCEDDRLNIYTRAHSAANII